MCSKGKAKTVVNAPTSSLTAAVLQHLPEKKQEILPDDSNSMIGTKRRRELLEEELQHSFQDDPQMDDSDGPIDDIEQRREPLQKR